MVARSSSFGCSPAILLPPAKGFRCWSVERGRANRCRAFETAGISGFDVFDFSREGKRPDGAPVKLAFSLAFARDPSSPDLGFVVCQHHYPETFWNRDFQRHANGASRIPGAAMIVENRPIIISS